MVSAAERAGEHACDALATLDEVNGDALLIGDSVAAAATPRWPRWCRWRSCSIPRSWKPRSYHLLLATGHADGIRRAALA